jgi:hypothetical protein
MGTRPTGSGIDRYTLRDATGSSTVAAAVLRRSPLLSYTVRGVAFADCTRIVMSRDTSVGRYGRSLSVGIPTG